MQSNVGSAYESYHVGACMTDATAARTRVDDGGLRRRAAD